MASAAPSSTLGYHHYVSGNLDMSAPAPRVPRLELTVHSVHVVRSFSRSAQGHINLVDGSVACEQTVRHGSTLHQFLDPGQSHPIVYGLLSQIPHSFQGSLLEDALADNVRSYVSRAAEWVARGTLRVALELRFVTEVVTEEEEEEAVTEDEEEEGTELAYLMTTELAYLLAESAWEKGDGEEEEEEGTCTVCFEDFLAEERIVRMPCRHPFHKECIAKWLARSNSCPVCRFEILG